MYKVDLHTHSIASPDGGLTAADYQQLLDSGDLDMVAITDHDTIEFAAVLQKKLGKRIIIGEEVKTAEGEIIGLFLTKGIRSGQTPEATIEQIREQGGLVYVPHPFESLKRPGLTARTLDSIAQEVDIIEIYNGRAYIQNESNRAKDWATVHQIAGAASSDAHGRSGWGQTYSIVRERPNRDTLVKLLHEAKYSERRVGLRGLAYPSLNRLKKRFAHGL